LLVFVDDDVVLRDGALNELHGGSLAAGDNVAAFGRVEPYESVTHNVYVRLAYADLAHSAPSHAGGDRLFMHFCTSFAAVPRAAFEAAGGFDERFRLPGYEDVELAFRLEQAGTRLVFCPHAAAGHLRQMDRAWFLGRCRTAGRLLRMFVDLHPDARNSRHRVMARLAWLRPLLHAGWAAHVPALPLVERLPAFVAVPWLRGIYALALTDAFCAARKREPAP
jgi:GT2 family glycosyltransferase